MKRYQITIEGHTYEVEVDDPRARPVCARVDGVTFLVDPQPAAPPGDVPGAAAAIGERRPAAQPGRVIEAAHGAAAKTTLRAPIPGLVVSITATVGQVIKRGDMLLTIEAMKMMNLIRSPWEAATVSEIHVTDGKHVAQGEPLVTVSV